jgi:hypothetical protein
MKDNLKKLIGELPSESEFKQRMRSHQAWWRAFVLAEEPGIHPIRKKETIGSTIMNGKNSHKNFLSPKIVKAIDETIVERGKINSGILQEDRLFNNLLSSQPLCFNFFGELKNDLGLALKILQRFYPDFTEVVWVKFEFAPEEKYTNDNSAFDVAFEVRIGDKTGLLGIECKYTDSFSSTEYDKEAYRQIYSQGKDMAFIEPYEKYITSKFNQLFRNQLIGEALVQKEKYDFVLTGLFCHHDDKDAQKTATEFQGVLKDGESKFRVITYQDYLKNVQQLDIDWEQRELSMLLWARYCGVKLSEKAFS